MGGYIPAPRPRQTTGRTWHLHGEITRRVYVMDTVAALDTLSETPSDAPTVGLKSIS